MKGTRECKVSDVGAWKNEANREAEDLDAEVSGWIALETIGRDTHAETWGKTL